MYFVAKNGQQTGPYTLEQLRQMAAAGQLLRTELVWREGMAEWQAAETVVGVFDGTGGGGAPAVTGGAATGWAPATRAGLPRTNPMALTGMILGITSLPAVLCCSFLSTPLSVGGIVCALIAFNQIKANPQRESGRGMAHAGLWCSAASLGLTVVMLVFGLALGGIESWDSMLEDLPLER
jgi:hypothetical protein